MREQDKKRQADIELNKGGYVKYEDALALHDKWKRAEAERDELRKGIKTLIVRLEQAIKEKPDGGK